MGTMFIIPANEISRQAVASQGPGGQHVNKTSTKIELRWNVARSPSLNEAAKNLLASRLSTRIGASGDLRISCQETRSQYRNYMLAVEKLNRLVNAALKVDPERVLTTPSISSQENRLNEKTKNAKLKVSRRPPSIDD